MINSKFYPFFIALGLSILFFIIYILLGNQGIILSLEPNESIGDISRWCERVSGGIFREPSNALSNILLPIIINILNSNSIARCFEQYAGLRQGIYIYKGILSNKNVGDWYNMDYTDIDLLTDSF